MKLNKRIKLYEEFAGTAMDSSNNTAPASKTTSNSVAVDKTNVKSDDATKKAEGEKVRASVIKDVDAILTNLSKLSDQIKEHYMINEEVSMESVLASLKSSFAIAKCESKLGKYKKIALMANKDQQTADNIQGEFKTMAKFDKQIEAAEGEKKVKLKEAKKNAKTELDHNKEVNAEKLKNALQEFEDELGEAEKNIAKDSPLGKVYFKRKAVLKNIVAEEGLENKAKVFKAMGKKEAALAAAGELKEVQQKGKELAQAIADGEKEASDDIKELEGVKAFLPEIEAIQKTSVAIKKIGDQADAHINKLKPAKKEETTDDTTTDDTTTDDTTTDDTKTGNDTKTDNTKTGNDTKTDNTKTDDDTETDDDKNKIKEESLDIDNIVENAKVEDLYSKAKGANDEGALNKAKELASALKSAAAEELAAKTALANKISGKEVPKTIIILAGGDDESAKEGEDGYTLGNFIDKYGGGSSIVGKEDYSPIKIADEILASVDDAIASATGKSDDTATDDDTSKDDTSDDETPEKNSKKDMIARYKKLIDGTDDEEKKKKYQDKIDKLSKTEESKFLDPDFIAVLEAELLAFENSINESEELPKKVKLYVGMSIADRFKALM